MHLITVVERAAQLLCALGIAIEGAQQLVLDVKCLKHLLD